MTVLYAWAWSLKGLGGLSQHHNKACRICARWGQSRFPNSFLPVSPRSSQWVIPPAVVGDNPTMEPGEVWKHQRPGDRTTIFFKDSSEILQRFFNPRSLGTPKARADRTTIFFKDSSEILQRFFNPRSSKILWEALDWDPRLMTHDCSLRMGSTRGL